MGGQDPGAPADAPATSPQMGKVFSAEKRIAGVRLAVIATGTILYPMVLDKTGTIPWLAYSLLGLAWVYGTYVYVAEPYRSNPVLLSSYVSVVTDAFFTMLWLYATGGFESPFYIALYLAVVAVAFRFGPKETMFAATAYAAGYVALLWLTGELVAHEGETLTRVTYIFLAGLVGGVIAKEMLVETGEKQEARLLAQDLDRQVRERKEAEKELRRQKDQYETLLQAQSDAGEAVAVVDILTQRVIYANDAILRVLGYTRDELQGTPFTAFAAPESMDIVVSLVKAAIGGKRLGERYEVVVLRKDGRRVTVEVTAKRLEGQPGLKFMIVGRDVTERKAHEVALEQSERRFMALSNAALVGVVIHENGKIVECNAEFARMYGYSRDELLGKNGLDLIAPASVEEVKRGLMDLRGDTYLVTALRKDGSTFLMEGAARDLTFEGRPASVATVRDVTASKRAETEIKETASLYSATLESTGDAIVVIGRGGKIRSYNQRFIEMWKIPESMMRSGDDAKAIASVLGQLSDPEAFVKKVDALYADPDAESFDEIRFRDGRIVERYSRPQRVSGKSVGRVWSFRDVTERRQAEEALRNSEEKYRRVVDSIQDGYYEVDRHGTIILFNDSLARLTGLGADELFHANYADFMDKAEAFRVFQAFNSVWQTGGPMDSFPFTLRHKRGEETPVECSVSLVVDDHGHKAGFRGILRNVAERRRADELAEQAKELERLKDMNEFKARFLNTAAHELNTPLTPIKLQLHLLRTEAKGTLAPGQARAVVLLERNIDRLGRLVGDLLEASRLQAGKLGIEHKPVDVNVVAREAIESFNEPARRAGVELVLHEGPKAIVLGDDKRLTQVLYNLLSNAVKFTEEGGRIDIDTGTHRGAAVVRVSDTGVGIPRPDMKRLFQPFSQVPDPGGKPRPGTGLGLYVSKGIVELHAGRIWCESAGRGQGASFAFEIPLASESNHTPPSAEGTTTGQA